MTINAALRLTIPLASLMVIAAGCSHRPDATPSVATATSTRTMESDPSLSNDESPGPTGFDSKTGIRFATYNVSLYRKGSGELIEDLATGTNSQAHKLATIIQHVRPDVLLLNEFDYDTDGAAADSFCDLYLGVDHGDVKAIAYPNRFSAESNTGQRSEFDFDKNGRVDDPADCFGYGVHPGQYGMLVLSKYPIDLVNVRTFQKFLWHKMPDARLPSDPTNQKPYYSAEALSAFRLSSKSHWDVPILIGDATIHFLVCHPTPPVFDGPEDRNGKRNHDEIRLFADYIDPERSDYLVDDQGQAGGLEPAAKFVIAGDLNADPFDGDSHDGAASQLVNHPRVQSVPIPNSLGAAELGQQGVNAKHRGDPANDTADFDDGSTGNLRIDYVLPSRTLSVAKSGVFWPELESPLHQLIKVTDHRLVWVDVTP